MCVCVCKMLNCIFHSRHPLEKSLSTIWHPALCTHTHTHTCSMLVRDHGTCTSILYVLSCGQKPNIFANITKTKEWGERERVRWSIDMSYVSTCQYCVVLCVFVVKDTRHPDEPRPPTTTIAIRLMINGTAWVEQLVFAVRDARAFNFHLNTKNSVALFAHFSLIHK